MLKNLTDQALGSVSARSRSSITTKKTMSHNRSRKGGQASSDSLSNNTSVKKQKLPNQKKGFKAKGNKENEKRVNLNNSITQ